MLGILWPGPIEVKVGLASLVCCWVAASASPRPLPVFCRPVGGEEVLKGFGPAQARACTGTWVRSSSLGLEWV